jgi:hypothetical protein
MAPDSQPPQERPELTVSPALTVFSLLVLYVFGLSLYRLFFHPLAKFPGPKLAAVTTWYEAYYEIVCNGQYSHKISELHDVYGMSASLNICATKNRLFGYFKLQL